MARPRSAAAAAAAAAAIARASGSAAAPAIVSISASAPSIGSSSSSAALPAARSSREHVVRLLSFNIWFDPLCMATRMRAIGSLVAKYRPAVIGFQEVTRESLAMLRKQQWSRYYDCSLDTAPPFSEAYFVVLFSALPVVTLESLPFANTGMGRELLAVNVQVAPGHTLLVGTSHLESLPQFKNERVSQLKQSLQFLADRIAGNQDGSTSLGAVLMGDMNLLRGDMKLLDPRCAAEEITVEAAKSSRSKCRKCSETIEKDSVRVGKSAKDKLPNGRTVEIMMWYHQDCFLARDGVSELDKLAVYQSPLCTSHADAQDKHPLNGTNSSTSEAVDVASLGLSSKWKDLWLTVAGNTESNGYTYDGKRNGVIKNKSYQSRFDRVYFHPGPRGDMRVFEQIELVGTEPIADGLWASDHFGLLTTFCFDSAMNERAEAKRKREESDSQDATSTGSKRRPIELE